MSGARRAAGEGERSRALTGRTGLSAAWTAGRLRPARDARGPTREGKGWAEHR
jgi:hypothetical protein